MAHEIDTTTGRAGMAYVGQTPWHGLGQELTPNAPLELWQQEAGLDWEAKEAPVRYNYEHVDATGLQAKTERIVSDRKVLYRSDTGNALSVVSTRYKPVQPGEIIEFYRDLTERYGFVLETAGSLKGGQRIWALANAQEAAQLRDKDENRLYLLLATSFDGSMATQARMTNIRVVCNNTMSLATAGKANVTVSHATTFDADQIKLEMQIGEAWEQFKERAAAMSTRSMGMEETVRYFMDVYFNLTSTEEIKAFHADEANAKRSRKTVERLTQALFNSPGAHMASARGMLWGALNAVTYDTDHIMPARSQENRLNSAWFGQGEARKQRAWDKALELL